MYLHSRPRLAIKLVKTSLQRRDWQGKSRQSVHQRSSLELFPVPEKYASPGGDSGPDGGGGTAIGGLWIPTVESCGRAPWRIPIVDVVSSSAE